MTRSTSGRLFVLTLVATGFLADAALARAQIVDQEQPVIDVSVGDAVLGGPANQQLAQVFTAGRSGLLTAVEFPLECGSFSGPTTGTITLAVRDVIDGVPGDGVLSSSTFDPVAFPLYWPNDYPPYLRLFQLAAPVAVTAGLQYALTLRFETSGDTNCAVPQGPEGDSYAGGDGWYRENGPFGWAPLGSRLDLPFRTLVEPSSVEEPKISVLHNGHWICVSRSALAAHLRHRDTTGLPGCRR